MHGKVNIIFNKNSNLSYIFRSEDEPDEMVINQFVIDLITTVDKFGRKWYGKRGFDIHMTKMTTPYGGRLIWELPGKTKIICHLKDKNKIRHKKRYHKTFYVMVRAYQ